ncbi:RNA polymerase sigma factor [Brevibacillus sp. 179-C9.3 HS]|uniref:RNA polymerase sigma factor n=1 Tax=unclassified Brevibacillus TaxID=2684853 RepID=UPI0039A0F72D
MDHLVIKPKTFEETEQTQDEALVERAKAGDQEAFGELVRRHRSKVYGYARSYTQEAFLAEDIVQDALIRAFLHLGTLVDSRRFLPWLHRIVRNQAYTRLAKGSQKRETVFSSLGKQTSEQEPTDWEDLDSILHRLGRTWSPTAQNINPEEVMVRRELFETITSLLYCLNPRERRIVESHFFDHLAPHEIAHMFQMSQANVYQVLSRSRKKLIQEKTRVVVDQYMKTRKVAGSMKQAILNKPEAFTLPTWVTCAAALYGLVESTERKMSLPMILGLSGHAFRLTIVPETIHIAGPTMFHFQRVLQQGLRNMGFESRAVTSYHLSCAPSVNANQVDSSLLSPDARAKRQLSAQLPEALELIHRSIDKGNPVLAWDLFMPEFGLIYGYDDEKRVFYAGDNCRNDSTIPYENLGRGILEELFVLAIDRTLPIDQRTMLASAIQAALVHYRGEEPLDLSCANGLAAYAVWLEAYEKGTIEPNGNSYTTIVAANARRNASLFWSEIVETWTDAVLDEIRPLMKKAASLYGAIADDYDTLSMLFPFPAGGEPNDTEQGKQAIALLQAIERNEREAVSLLEKMHAGLADNQ